MKKNSKTHVGSNTTPITNFFTRQDFTSLSRVKKQEKSLMSSNSRKRKDIPDKIDPPKKKYNGRTSELTLEMLYTHINDNTTDFKEKTSITSSKLTNNTVVEETQCNMNVNAQDKENVNDLGLTNINFDEWEDDTFKNFDLDLTKGKYCEIINISNLQSKIILLLKSGNNHGECSIEGFWVHTNLNISNKIYITAKYLQNMWVVNNDYGLIVVEPELLMTPTAVVGSMWCKRRSLLSQWYKGFETSNQAMLVGMLVHSILQYALKNNLFEVKELEKISEQYICKPKITRALYDCGISLNILKEEVFRFIPNLQDFLKTYVNFGKSVIKDNWKGNIDTIEDIEENIWCPELGIKGKIDVTVKSNGKVMPLELKTGKATSSMEHRGQIMLYLMMMRKVGYNVTSGLLLYLKENVLKEISLSQNEERDLIYLRNELVHYLSKKPELINDNHISPPDLPEPINHSSCSKCPYSNICMAYAHFKGEDISDKKHLKPIQDKLLSYCNQTHINYFFKWSCLVMIENEAKSNIKESKEIYLLTPEERELKGKCINNLIISKDFEVNDEMFIHQFEKCNSTTNLLKSGIMESNYVIISTEKRYAVAAGFVTQISSSSIKICVERNLLKTYKNQKFIVDSCDSSMKQTFQFSSLALLLEDTPKASNLRKIIIDKTPPTFKETLPKKIAITGKEILKSLNLVQQRAVLKAVTANDYFLIKGMPGTGKTATIVALIELLYALGKTVLITSHTNAAVDNVCLKLLKNNIKFIRLGSKSKIHKDLWEYSEHYLTENCTSPEEYEEIYNKAQILAVTCIGSEHPVLSKRSLDICIVDESTQVLQSSIFRPLYACKTFILLGDPDQLPAVVKNTRALELGMSESLFERLYRPEATIALNINYRMNKTITKLANCLTYNNELKVADENIGNATINLNKKDLDAYKKSWLVKILDDSLENAVQFIDTGSVWSLPQEASWKLHVNYNSDDNYSTINNINIYEAAVVFKLVKAFIKCGIDSHNIGVIASFRHQIQQLSLILKDYNVDINTVDQFQGKDKSIIIYSCGLSRDPSVFNTPGKFDILNDKRRLNVAVTRAKHKLIIIGDVGTLMVYAIFKKLIDNFKNNVVKLTECEDFSWDKILELD